MLTNLISSFEDITILLTFAADFHWYLRCILLKLRSEKTEHGETHLSALFNPKPYTK